MFFISTDKCNFGTESRFLKTSIIMKKSIFIISSLIFLSSAVLFAQEERKANPKDQMAFETLSHDYGSLVYDADGTYDFKFTNNADKPIVVTNVKASCGCTTPSWPKEPIQPGKTGSITVKYNTKLAGTFNKTVQVFSTAENSPVKLIVRGKVNARPSDIKSSQSSTGLLNGTGKKDLTGITTKESAASAPPVASQATATSSEGLSKSKQVKQQNYQKKLEEQKTVKK